MLIRDPIHGDISLDPVEEEVLDSPELQRLRGIKQLGTASLVYPGCLHTRFDHSLGVNALSKRIITAVRDAGTAVDQQVEQLVGVAALLHDVTHVPFGYTLEDERRLFPRHDKGTRLVKLFADRLGARLEALGLREPLAALLGAPASVAAVPPWAREVVAGTVDADLLDYLRRDAYFAGLAASYDDRIFRYFCVEDGQLVVNMTKHGMERPDARSETVQLLRLRYFLTERVYYHHTKVTSGAMISKAVELAREYGALDEDELLRLNDGTLLQRLHQIPTAALPDTRIAGLVDRLERRALLKRGYVISALTVPVEERRRLVERFHESARNRREAEEILARETGCEPSEVILYCPALTVMKEAAALVRTPKGIHSLNVVDGQPSSEIQALEARYAGLWRLYVFVPEAVAGRTAAAAGEIFGYPSEHQVGARR